MSKCCGDVKRCRWATARILLCTLESGLNRQMSINDKRKASTNDHTVTFEQFCYTKQRKFSKKVDTEKPQCFVNLGKIKKQTDKLTLCMNSGFRRDGDSAS